jgi:hypothetical protein
MVTKKLLLSAAVVSLSLSATMHTEEGNVTNQYPFAFSTTKDAFNDTYVVSNEAQVVKSLGHYQYKNMGTVEEITRARSNDGDNRLEEIAHLPAVACSALLLLINGNCSEYDKFQELVAQHGSTDLSHFCPELAQQKIEDAHKNLLGEDGSGQQDLTLVGNDSSADLTEGRSDINESKSTPAE